MTLDVSEKLSRQFQDLARRRRAARGRIDPAPPSVRLITCGKRLSTRQTVELLADDITDLKKSGMTWPEITVAFNARFGSAIAPTTMQIYHESAVRSASKKKESSDEGK